MAQPYCVIDYETFSEADLTEVGAYEYARHPSTRILAASWRIGEKALLDRMPVHLWLPPLNRKPPKELVETLSDPSIQLVAANAFFEQVITRFVLPRYVTIPEIPIERWICTASQARALALPGKLEMACQALQLPVEKDMEGHRLMLKMSKPRNPSKNNPSTRHNKVSDLLRLGEYCKRDVEAETELFLATDELSPTERKVWCLNQKIAWRGFRVDRDLVTKTLKLIDEEILELDRETTELTSGQIRSTKQRDRVLKFMPQAVREMLPDLTRESVEKALALPWIDSKSRRLLEIRQAASMSSTAKYVAFEARSRTDSRARDNLVYHAASTGRDGGSGIQPQNFPRGTIKDTDTAVEIVKTSGLPFIRALYDKPMGVFSSILRGGIVASPGKELFCGDYAAIEVRVLFWMADHEAGLSSIREERDLYREIAAIIYNVPLNKVTKEQREVGKRAVLGCGYGMGPKRFAETCEQFGQAVSEELAKTAVHAYREFHRPVPRLWENLERAAIAAVQNPSKSFRTNHTKWFMRGKYLFSELPSGRRLPYYGAHVKWETKFGRKRPELRYYGVNTYTKKWSIESTWGGKLAENVVQGGARDLLKYAEPRIENKGYELLLLVHDEVLSERTIGEGKVEEFEKIMAEVPPWGIGLPIKVEAWKKERYGK